MDGAPSSGAGVTAPARIDWHDFLSLIVLVVCLSLFAHLLAGPHAMPFFDRQRGLMLLALAGVFLLCLLLVALLQSLWRVRRHVDPATRQADLAALWRGIGLEPLPGMLVVALTAYGVTASGNLAEVYRLSALIWYDDVLWRIEAPLFSAFLGSVLDRPALWDGVYFQMWTFVLLATAVVHARGGVRPCARLGAAIVLAFFLTRGVNLALPTAGPVFFQPALFHLEGTSSRDFQELLLRYMAGDVPQVGVYPATMAMPSLHIALTGLAAAFLAVQWRWSLLLSLPWLVLVWMSTVMLGWHYALDGVGGLAIAWLAAQLASAGERLARRATGRARQHAC